MSLVLWATTRGLGRVRRDRGYWVVGSPYWLACSSRETSQMALWNRETTTRSPMPVSRARYRAASTPEARYIPT